MHAASAVKVVTPMRTGPYNARQKPYSSVCTERVRATAASCKQRPSLLAKHLHPQLQAEGKSVNTQKSYMIGLRHLIETPYLGRYPERV